MRSHHHSAGLALFLAVALFAKSSRGQQKPLFDISTESNETFRTNFCERQRQVENGSMALKDALKDLNLRPALFRYQLNSDTGAIDEVDPSIGIKMLDEIARRGQFKWRDSYGVVDSPGENQTWGDVLEWSIDTYDMNGDWFLSTMERLAKGIKFPETWYDGSLIMVRRKPEETSLVLNINPFTPGLWALIVATTIISGVVFYVIEYIGCDGEKSKMEVSMRESIFQSFLNATGQYVFDPTEPGNRLVAFSACMLFLIILATYTASLTNSLLAQTFINNMEDAIKNDLRVCVWQGTNSETFMRERYDTARLVPVGSLTESYRGLDEGICDIVLTTVGTWETKKGDIIYNKDCKKEWVGRMVQFNTAGFALRDSTKLCSSLLLDVISFHMLEMKDDETFDIIWDTHRAKEATNDCQAIEVEDKENTDKLAVNNLGGIFILHGVVTSIAIATALFSKYKRNRRAAIPFDRRSAMQQAPKSGLSQTRLNTATQYSRRSMIQHAPKPDLSQTRLAIANKFADQKARKSFVAARMSFESDPDCEHDLDFSEEDGSVPANAESMMKLMIAMKQSMEQQMEQQMEAITRIQAQLAELNKQDEEET